MRRWLAIGLAVAGLGGCVGDVSVDDVSFPCRTPEDCAEGFICAEDRFVCVPSDQPSPTDAGTADTSPADSATADLGL